ncbi:hypothetical protein EMN47_09445 [Prolixibacteraceae bacterium JC049]|nr:hypothetical protein [Prolixibacteraceae bacterium JC049]
MIKPLRSRHQIIWFIMPLIVVPLLVLSIIQRPDFSKNTKEIATSTPAIGNILKEVENQQLKVNLRGEDNTYQQLEVIVKTPIEAPFTIVYGKLSTGKNITLGTIGQRGVYRYSLTPGQTLSEIVLQDKIKQTEINRLKLK